MTTPLASLSLSEVLALALAEPDECERSTQHVPDCGPDDPPLAQWPGYRIMHHWAAQQDPQHMADAWRALWADSAGVGGAMMRKHQWTAVHAFALERGVYPVSTRTLERQWNQMLWARAWPGVAMGQVGTILLDTTLRLMRASPKSIPSVRDILLAGLGRNTLGVSRYRDSVAVWVPRLDAVLGLMAGALGASATKTLVNEWPSVWVTAWRTWRDKNPKLAAPCGLDAAQCAALDCQMELLEAVNTPNTAIDRGLRIDKALKRAGKESADVFPASFADGFRAHVAGIVPYDPTWVTLICSGRYDHFPTLKPTLMDILATMEIVSMSTKNPYDTWVALLGTLSPSDVARDLPRAVERQAARVLETYHWRCEQPDTNTPLWVLSRLLLLSGGSVACSETPPDVPLQSFFNVLSHRGGFVPPSMTDQHRDLVREVGNQLPVWWRSSMDLIYEAMRMEPVFGVGGRPCGVDPNGQETEWARWWMVRAEQRDTKDAITKAVDPDRAALAARQKNKM